MALFENVPYVNFHEMNLDWILKFIQETRNKLDQIEAAVLAAQAAKAGAETARAGAEEAESGALAAQTAAEEAAASVPNYTDIKTLAAIQSSYVLITDPLIVKSRSEITNPQGIGADFSGMVEYSLPWAAEAGITIQTLPSSDYGNFELIPPNYPTGIAHQVIAIRPINGLEANRYDIIPLGTYNISDFVDGDGHYHLLARVFDRTTDDWAVDGTTLNGVEVQYSLTRSARRGTVHNGTHA